MSRAVLTSGSTAKCLLLFFLVQLSYAAIPVAPANDRCTNALELTGGTPYTGTSATATDDTGIASNCGSTNGFTKGVWFFFRSGSPSDASVSVCGGATWDTYIRIFSGGCSGLTCVAHNDNSCGSQSEIVDFALEPFTNYYILLAGFSGSSSGAYTITWRYTIYPWHNCDNNDCINAYTLSPSVPFSCYTTTATDDTGITSNCGSTNGFRRGVWFVFNSGVANQVSVSTCEWTTFDTYLRLFSGGCSGLTCVAGNDDSCGVKSLISNQAIAPFTTYYILLAGKNTGVPNTGYFGDYTLTMTLTTSTCGNTQCDATETFESCTLDCPSTCGNPNACDPVETFNLCPHDCTLSSCGNNRCDAIETYDLCPHDCIIPTCGNPNTCDSAETFNLCPHDCNLPSCGSGQCDASETYDLCPHDCTSPTSTLR